MKKARVAFFVAVLVFVALDFLIPRHEPHFPWDSVPGFSAVFGLSSAIIVIFVARILGMCLKRGEDYYE